MYVAEHPERVRRRLVPDAVQVQVILGSLLGDARIEGEAGERRMRVVHGIADADYAWWKYDRLGAFAAHAPVPCGGTLGFVTIAHPLFDDLAPFFSTRVGTTYVGARGLVRELLAPLGLAVWMTDRGRVRLSLDLFVPTRTATPRAPSDRSLALIA